ncbi:MAG: N-6 DNA methylase, partial [Mycoplasmatales bacterium]
LDAVIGLPSNLFYGTGIPACILVFKKNREHQNNILFIDASNEFEKVKTQNVLKEEHINKIIDTYTKRITIDKYSSVVPLSQIIENEYNLNIPRYVDTFEEEEIIDIDEVMDKLEELQKEQKELKKIINIDLKELGLRELK